MNADTDFIKDVVKLGNDSYRAGYEEGIREGKRQAYAEFKRLMDETFTKPEAVTP